MWARTFSGDALYQVRDLSLVTDGERVYPGLSSGGGTGFAAYDAATGDLVWSFALSADLTNAGAEALALSSGRLYVSGDFEGTVDFDPGPGTALRTAADPTTAIDVDDPFIAAYDAATGAYLWANHLVTSRRGNRTSDVWEIAADGDRVYATGRLGLIGGEPGSIDLDPSAGEALLEGSDDVFLAAYDAATGAYLWGDHLVGNDPLGGVGAVVGIAGGQVLLSAAFGSSSDASLDLDPSDAEVIVEADNQRAWFATYDVETGALLDGSTYGGDAASRMELATSGRRFALTNWFSGPADIDPTSSGAIEQTPTNERAVFVISLAFPPSVATEPGPDGTPSIRADAEPVGGPRRSPSGGGGPTAGGRVRRTRPPGGRPRRGPRRGGAACAGTWRLRGPRGGRGGGPVDRRAVEPETSAPRLPSGNRGAGTDRAEARGDYMADVVSSITSPSIMPSSVMVVSSIIMSSVTVVSISMSSAGSVTTSASSTMVVSSAGSSAQPTMARAAIRGRNFFMATGGAGRQWVRVNGPERLGPVRPGEPGGARPK